MAEGQFLFRVTDTTNNDHGIDQIVVYLKPATCVSMTDDERAATGTAFLEALAEGFFNATDNNGLSMVGREFRAGHFDIELSPAKDPEVERLRKEVAGLRSQLASLNAPLEVQGEPEEPCWEAVGDVHKTCLRRMKVEGGHLYRWSSTSGQGRSLAATMEFVADICFCPHGNQGLCMDCLTETLRDALHDGLHSGIVSGMS